MSSSEKPNSQNSPIVPGSTPSHRVASPVRQDPKFRAPSSEKWYFKIDGKEFGPSSRDQLEHFLQPPRLCKSLEVMCSEREGFWFLVAVDETIDVVLDKVGIVPPPESTSTSAEEPVWRPPSTTSKVIDWFQDQFLVLSELVSRHFAILLAVVGIIVVNVVILYVTADPYVREREILSRFETLWRDAQKFDDDDDKWPAFAASASTEIEPIVKQLARTANRDRPVTQSLLFVGRDYLTKLFQAKSPPEKGSVDANVVGRYLKLANEQLGGEVR